MKKITLPIHLMNALHNKTIVVNYSGTKMEVTEKSFLDAVDMNRNNFEIDIYTVQCGDKTLAVIQNLQLYPKHKSAVIHKPEIHIHKRWYQLAANILN